MSNIYFQRDIPFKIWMASKSSLRWATDEECRKEFGISRDEWIRRWQTAKPQLGGKH